jgi:hypothetical protein
MVPAARVKPYPAKADDAVAAVLMSRVRVLSLRQIARTWGARSADPRAYAQRLVARLVRRGIAHPITLMARPEIPPTEPLATWQPGLPQPDLGSVAWQLQSRRRQQSAVTTKCVVATSRRPPRATEATHDLHLAAVFLLMSRELPTRAASWVFEDDLSLPADKVPDAVVTDGRARTVIECGGEYGRRRLEEDHRFFAQLGYGYEIW